MNQPSDSQFQASRYEVPQREHRYGDRIRLVDDPYLLTLTAELSDPATVQPRFNEIVVELYRCLFQFVANECLRRDKVTRPTRMQASTPLGVFRGEVISRDQKVVLVDLARAGIVPTMEGMSFFSKLVAPENVRVDHFFISRSVDEVKHQVTGAAIAGTKIGGPIEDCTLIIADPMGATGVSVINTLEFYEKYVKGSPRRRVVINLITAPEAIAAVRKRFPDVELFTLRLDRGLSDAKTLSTPPGSNPAGEKGLNEHQYIVPGAGGVGEVMNNSFV